MDSVDPNSKATTYTGSSGNVGSTQGVADKGEVALGYNSENTSSTTSANQGQSTGVAMDQPSDVTVTRTDLLQKSFDAKLDSFRAIVHEFNRRFDAESIDLNDTQSLILMFKGMLSDTLAMVSAASIDQNFSNRSLAQSKRKDAAEESLELRDQVKERTAAIEEKRSLINEADGLLAEKNTSKQLKEHQLANAEKNNDVDQANSLRLQITQLEHEITYLRSGVANLNQQIQTGQAQNVADNQQADRLSQTLELTVEEFVNVVNLLGKVKQRFDPAALETGEEEREVLQAEEQVLQAELGKRERKRVNQKESVEEAAKQLIKQETVDQERRLAPSALSLSAEDKHSLGKVFGPRNEEEVSQVLSRSQEHNTDLPPAEEGFAIALGSGLLEQSQEKSQTAAAEKQYGDSLSLEGATNPQIHSRIWREKDFVEGEDTQNIKEAQLQEGEERVEIHPQSVTEALQDFEKIPMDVAEMYEKQQEAAREISRNSRA